MAKPKPATEDDEARRQKAICDLAPEIFGESSPWRLKENGLAGYGDNGPNFSIEDNEGETIATLPIHHRIMEGESERYWEYKIYARLIAASPELYSALVETIDTMLALARIVDPNQSDAGVRNGPTCVKARAALAKARGEI